jgi:hypothetical protein
VFKSFNQGITEAWDVCMVQKDSPKPTNGDANIPLCPEERLR